jgi:hypothetical protein
MLTIRENKKTGSTPGTSKHFQPFRNGLISIIVITNQFAFSANPGYLFM